MGEGVVMTRNTVAMGAGAEEAAAHLLLERGYHIVERNFRCRAGELDLVARDRDVLVFVEVRSRADGDHGHAAEMVDAQKQRRVARVAECYLALRDPDYREVRFDVVAITGGQAELIPDAWRI
jgi:putative endonuclease